MSPLRRWPVYVLFGAVLATAILKHPLDDAVTAYTLSLVYLAFALVAVSVTRQWSGSTALVALAVQWGLTLVLLWVAVRQSGGGIPEVDRTLHVAVVFLAFAAYPFVAPDAREYLRANLGYVVAALAVLGIFLYHVASLPSGSGRAAFPVFAGLVFVLSLLFAPRYVPRRVFLSVVAVLSGVVVAAGLFVYVGGEYTLGPVPVRTWGTPVRLPGLDTGIPALRSVFPNPNTLGILAFAGTVASLAVAAGGYDDWRSATRPSLGAVQTRPTTARDVALVGGGTALLALNAVGLVLSGSRASMLAAAVGVAVYLSARLGPRGRRYGFGASVAAVGLFLGGVYLGLLPVSPGNRFALWGGGIAAVADQPRLVGHGIVSGATVIEPYVDGPASGYSPHNSYLSTFIRIGLLGGACYLVLTAVNVLDGALALAGRWVHPAPLALATGFTLHQLFESYSLFHLEVGSVLGALAFGYLLVSRAVDSPASPTGTARESATRTGGRAAPSRVAAAGPPRDGRSLSDEVFRWDEVSRPQTRTRSRPRSRTRGRQ